MHKIMTKIPIITVQIIHIEGPLKGKIDSFTDTEITLGRHPSCHVTFPRELNYISRKHAQIIREGNRFKLIDLSANGTLLNGKPIKEKFLNDGDVVFMTEAGPKFSFIKELSNETTDIPHPHNPLETRPFRPVETHQPPSPTPSAPPAPEKTAHPVSSAPSPVSGKESIRGTVPADQQLVIQYGLGIMSFKQFPIIMGSHPDCDLKLQEDNIYPKHAEITFADNAYIVNDLTGQGVVTLNGMPAVKLSMKIGAILKISPSGPTFELVGKGRLMAVTDIPPAEKPQNSLSPSISTPNDENEKASALTRKGKKKFLGIF